ncbi:MAG TPA: glycosyltransferase family 2 protein [Bacteroidia bacterium]|nr:glycosyltransferase family 2 protein [Bacteroidia bacterium]
MLKVSIITVCYNSSETIESTIQSVISQNYTNIEYIIVDGLSTDDTLKIVERYKSKISQTGSFGAKVISERDNGIYDAINKGITQATGDIIAILHADDFYTNENVISTIVDSFNKQNVDTVYGDLQYVDRIDTAIVKRNWISGAYQKQNFLKGWMPPHPSFFARKYCYEKFGNFNTDLKSAADYELMLRFLYKNNCSVAYIPQVLVKMRVGGKSNVSLMNRIKANREDKKAWEINGLSPSMFTFIRKPLSKLGQFFKKD